MPETPRDTVKRLLSEGQEVTEAAGGQDQVAAQTRKLVAGAVKQLSALDNALKIGDGKTLVTGLRKAEEMLYKARVLANKSLLY